MTIFGPTLAAEDIISAISFQYITYFMRIDEIAVFIRKKIPTLFGANI